MLLDGKKLARHIQDQLKEKIATYKNRPPCLAVILVGKHPPSEIYVKKKTDACRLIGIASKKFHFPDTITQNNLISEIKKLNQNDSIDGILVQLPLPKTIDSLKIMETVDPSKDVDGFHPQNVGKLLIGQRGGFVPCTPLGIEALLHSYGVKLTGKHAVIIGKSNIVGRPMAALLLANSILGEPTVSVLHKKSKNMTEMCKSADLLIVAAGKPKLITEDMVKKGAIIVDVGITRLDEEGTSRQGKIVGDVDFENVKDRCSSITPVPGGVGPMTIAMLLANTLKSYEMHLK